MDAVDETLREWRRGQFVYGQSDCMLSIGRYLAVTGHEDVTGRFAGRYEDHESAERMMREHGGVAGLVALAGAVPRAGSPERGDVVEVEVGDLAIGGICTGEGVALRLDRGVVEVLLRFVTVSGVWHGCRR